MTPTFAMPNTIHSVDSSDSRKIEYLSQPMTVNMADRWFEIASVDHFWVRRRFAVLERLTGEMIPAAKELAEIGCGHGLLQRQIEDRFGKDVAGFDLNDYALKKNVSRSSKVCCYDICQQELSLRERFDIIFLFDVLEHLEEEKRFLQAVLFHLAPGGKLVINVPAGKWAFSAYDKAAGHVRRYSKKTLAETANRNGLELAEWTYWGFPLIPTLAVRKLWLAGKQDQSKIISMGFASGSTVVNGLLGFVSRCELLPQKLMGTSLMAVFQKQADSHQQRS